MRTDIAWAALIGGAATVMIRLLPSLFSDRLAPDRLAPRARAMVQSLGPAAIAALLALSLKSSAHDHVGPTLVGLTAVIAVHRLTGRAIAATLSGALAYGLTIAVTAF